MARSILLQNLPLHFLRINVPHPREIPQPQLRLVRLILWPFQTPPCHITIHTNILDQRIQTDIVILGPNEAQHQQIQRGAVKVVAELVEDVNLDAAYRVLVEWVVSYTEH